MNKRISLRQECESEWSHNKKLISLRDKPLRRSVPKGLPYFHVDFGEENGFAHVIEDEKEFPKIFAQGSSIFTFCEVAVLLEHKGSSNIRLHLHAPD